MRNGKWDCGAGTGACLRNQAACRSRAGLAGAATGAATREQTSRPRRHWPSARAGRVAHRITVAAWRCAPILVAGNGDNGADEHAVLTGRQPKLMRAHCICRGPMVCAAPARNECRSPGCVAGKFKGQLDRGDEAGAVAQEVVKGAGLDQRLNGALVDSGACARDHLA